MTPISQFFKKSFFLSAFLLFSFNSFGTDISRRGLKSQLQDSTPQIIFNRSADILFPQVRFKGVVVGLPVAIPGTEIAIVEVKIIDPNVGAKRMAFVPIDYRISNGQVVYLRVAIFSIMGGSQNERAYIVERR